MKTLIAALGSILVAGCGSDAGPDADADADAGFCQVTVTGDRKLTLRESQDSTAVTDTADSPEDADTTVQSDYWWSEATIERVLSVLAGPGESVEQKMKKDPRVSPLLFNCGNASLQMSILPSNASKYADVPKAPKRYVIVAGSPISSSYPNKPGEFGVMFTITDKPGHRVYETSAPGVLDIQEFSGKRVRGTFSFEAREGYAENGKPENISVTGSFLFNCDMDNCN